MNAPERFSSFLLDEDIAEEKIVYASDTKVSNAGTFTINKEDHTVGNLLRMQLLRDPKVRFVGYKMPHPLINSLDLKIQTSSSEHQPVDALANAIQDLKYETEELINQTSSAIEKWKKDNFMEEEVM